MEYLLSYKLFENAETRKWRLSSSIKIAKERDINIEEGKYIRLFHGTSPANFKKILKSCMFKSGTFFAVDFDTSKTYANMTVTGKKESVVTMVYINAEALLPLGEYWVLQEPVYQKGITNFYDPK
jgi:hypothetical protein